MGVETPKSSVQLGSELVNVSLSSGIHRNWGHGIGAASQADGWTGKDQELAVVRQGDRC